MDRRIGGRGRVLTRINLVSLGLAWFHLVSLDFTWSHLVSLGLTWFHLVSLGFTWSRMVSLGFTCFHLFQNYFHFSSLGFTWTHLVSLDRGKKEKHGVPKREKGKRPRSKLGLDLTRQPERAHARTTRNDFPVGLTPPNLRYMGAVP